MFELVAVGASLLHTSSTLVFLGAIHGVLRSAVHGLAYTDGRLEGRLFPLLHHRRRTPSDSYPSGYVQIRLSGYS
eukprot:1482588-Pleurochrysis_carterae.AAC.1